MDAVFGWADAYKAKATKSLLTGRVRLSFQKRDVPAKKGRLSDMEKETLAEILARKFIEHIQAFLKDAETIRDSYGQLPQSTKAEINIPHIDLHELEHDPAWRSWRKDEKGQCSFAAGEGGSGWLRISKAGNTVLVLVSAMRREKLQKISLRFFEYKLSSEDFLQRRALRKPVNPGPHERMDQNLRNIKVAGEKLANQKMTKRK